MRELTKSMLSVSWALSLLGIKQAANLVAPGTRGQAQPLGTVFDSITETAVAQLDESMKGIFRSGDNMQSRFVDMMFGWLNPGSWNMMRNNCSQRTSPGRPSGLAQETPPSAEPSRNPGNGGGWGPMPEDTAP